MTHVHFDERTVGAMFALGLTYAGVRQSLVSAAGGVCRLWKTRSHHTAGLRGQTIYQICPACGELDVFIEFKITPDQELWVFSVHEDSERGRFR